MVQLYFLSILCNGLCGFILFADNNEETVTKFQFPVNNPTFHLILGIISAVTGVLKLLSPSMDRIPVIGDLVPAAAGIIAGFVMIFGIYRKDITSSAGGGQSGKSLEDLGSALLSFRKPLGLVLLAIALIHFLLPQALFL